MFRRALATTTTMTTLVDLDAFPRPPLSFSFEEGKAAHTLPQPPPPPPPPPTHPHPHPPTKKTGIARAVGKHPPAAFFGQQAVFRVSLASFCFFSGMALATSQARFKGDAVDREVQHGAWGLKLACWSSLTLGSFFLPVGLVAGYGALSRLGSALFLCVQILMLLDFVCELNDALVDAGEEDERCLWGLLGLSGGCYAAAAAFVAVSLYFFNPGTVPGGRGGGDGGGAGGGGGAGEAQDCSFNVAFIVAAPLGGLAVSALALSGIARRGSLFPSAALTLYATYCTYSAMVSEPHGYRCNALGRRIDAASATGMSLAVAATLGSVAYSALRVGSNASLLGLGPEAEEISSLDGATPLISQRRRGGAGRYGYDNDGDDDAHLTSAGLDGIAPAGARALPGSSDDNATVAAAAISSSSALPAIPITYSYAFFHAVFALASMHFAMLFSGYGSGAAERALVDVGWPSVGVKLACAWVSLGVYAWTLVAPALFPDRVF